MSIEVRMYSTSDVDPNFRSTLESPKGVMCSAIYQFQFDKYLNPTCIKIEKAKDF